MKIIQSLMLVFLLGIFFSCTNDDASFEKTISYIIEAALLAPEIPSNEDEDLEIYGEIFVDIELDKNVLEEKELWSRNRENYIVVGKTEVTLDNQIDFSIDKNNIDNSSIRLRAILKDYDRNNELDRLGTVFFRHQLTSEPQEIELKFNNTEGNTVLARFTIEPISD